MNNDTIIFLHIPKTAGSTLITTLKKRFNLNNSLFGTEDIPDIEMIVKRLSPEQRKDLKFITGHLEFGIHDLLPRPATYFSFLRNPVDRVISEYYFVLESPDHHLYKKVIDEKISLQEFVEQKLTLGNGQTRMIIGLRNPEVNCCKNSFTQAKSNIENFFSVIGLTERFDESLILLQKQYGWNQLSYARWVHKSKSRPKVEDLSEKTFETIINANYYDLKLYEFGKALFDQQVSTQISDLDRKIFAYNQLKSRFIYRIRQYSVREKVRQSFLYQRLS